ncbi:MAG: hypothetical protein Q9163_005469 [Psora crenata]
MRYSIIFAFAAVAYAQTDLGNGNPFTAYLTQTNSLGVVTATPVTTQPAAVTTQPTPVTTQPDAATSPAGTPSTTLIPDDTTAAAGASGLVASAASGIVGSAASAASGINATLASGSSAAVATVSSLMRSATGITTRMGSATRSGSATGTSGGASDSSAASTATGAAGMVEPAVGLGLAGAILAAFL